MEEQKKCRCGGMSREEAIKIAMEITEAAFWDNHTAGMLPGSGYNHKPYTLVSSRLGWRDTKRFEEWKAAITKPATAEREGGGK